MADEEQGKEEQQPEPAQALPETFTLEQVRGLVAESKEEGKREVQSVKDREVATKDKTISELQVLSGYNNLSDEERTGVTNLAEIQGSTAKAWAKAHSLSTTETRYLATLPASAQEAEAERIAAERGTPAPDSASLLNRLAASETQASPQGMADMTLTATGGGRPPSGGYKTVDAALDALSNMDPQTPEAKKLAADIGLPVQP